MTEKNTDGASDTAYKIMNKCVLYTVVSLLECI